MAAVKEGAIERARLARALAMLCALGMLGAAAWLAWKHSIGTLVVLDAERTLTLQAFLIANAVVLFAAAQPARFLNRPLDLRAVLVTAGAAGVNVGAVAFFLINTTFAVLALREADDPIWLSALFVPATAALFLFFTSFGVPPEGGDDISDDDIAEAALILTESQRRWSWGAVFEMAGFMAATRAIILGVYFVWLIVGMAMFEWLGNAFLETQPIGSEDLRRVGAMTLGHAGEILAQGWFWVVFVLVAVVPPLMVLSAAVWFRVSMRRERSRVRAISQTPAARLMTQGELQYLKRQIERPLIAAMKQDRAVS